MSQAFFDMYQAPKTTLAFGGQVFVAYEKPQELMFAEVALKKWSFVCVKFQAFHHPATWTLKKARRACMFHGKNNRKVTGMMDKPQPHWTDQLEFQAG